MKITLLLTTMLWILSFNQATAQQVLFKNQPKDSVIRSSPRMAAYEYVPGEIIVKFKDNVSIKSTGAKLKSASTITDALQVKYKVQKAEALFPGESRLKSAQMLTAPNGQKFLRPSLHNIYKLKIADEKQLMNAINDFKADSANVVYAEPNYIVSISNDKPIGPILTEADVQKMQQAKTTASFKAGSGSIVNDPLYSQQGYIPAIKADLVWPQTMGDTTQIIAILDTGVDWLHPDLKNKIWKNPNPNTMPDANGVVNDLRGWDFVNNDNNPMDDNSHGTHVAGIAAAETNNGIGIAGICPKAKIMPIKVFTSKGTGDVLTICKGIIYAYEHGATVINMSFGSYSKSTTLENVLINAFDRGSLLVASAGNDSYSIYDTDSRGFSLACYPAALSFVFGVQSDGVYSNYDPDGPVFSKYGVGYNYELKAPGTIFSTIPNGNYRIFTGTSMAAPIVSGIVSLYRSKYPEKSLEELWSDIIHSSNNIIDANEALFPTKKHIFLDLKSYELKDTIFNCDRDGFADANETINLFFEIRNTGNAVQNTFVKIKQANDGNLNNIEILNDSVYYGSIGVYRTLKNTLNPFNIKIKPNCQNNTDVSLDVTIGDDQSDSIYTQNIKFKVYNGSELSGILLRDTTLTPDKYWVINKSLRISQGVTLKILPGTTLEIHAPLDGRSSLIDNRGSFVAVGTPEKRVKIIGIDGNHYNMIDGNSTYSFADIDLNGYSIKGSKIENTTINNGWVIDISSINKSKITNLIARMEVDSITNSCYEKSPFGFNLSKNVYISDCTFDNLAIADNSYQAGSTIKNSLFTNIRNYNYIYNPPIYYTFKNTGYFVFVDKTSKNINKNSFLFNDVAAKFVKTTGSADMVTLSNQYWGTNNIEKIKNKYYDFNSNASLPYLNIEPKLIAPSDSCPGHVWKVLVNGKDAQDEAVDPVGVGKQRFDVYFNRTMNKDTIPQVSFGGIYPYTSNKINENGTWSDDGKIYTIYKTIKLTTGDGINQIRVAGAKQAGDWGWVIPVEDSRFSFIISAANSASVDFMATPGLGKVKLEWNNNNLEDGLGFNMYRMENINDSTLTRPVMINQTLITDTLYTDFNVLPNKRYYYYFKVLRTNMAETDSSKIVSAMPFTAIKGDANGDIKVDVLDIISIVSYLLGQNPTPFIFEAADVNNDKAVNVLDVVSVANIIKGPKSALVTEGKKYNPTLAYITLKPEIIQLKSDAQVTAFQFELQGIDLEKVKLSAALKGFELAYSIDSNKIKGVLYNLNGQTIPAGITDVIKIEAAAGSLTWGEVFGADPQGQYVTIMKKEDVSLTTEVSPFGLSVQPNPSGSDMHISFRLPETAYITVKVFNLLGEMVNQVMDNTLSAGNQQLLWNGTNGSGEKVKPGVYFIRVEAKGEKNQTIKENIKVVRL